MSEFGTYYAPIYMAKAARTPTHQAAKEWMEKVDVGPATAAELANKGYTADQVAAQVEAAPEVFGDERDAERVIDKLLYGPDVA
jgi:hypothetical protein